ncbi:hypothetical protein [Flavobacterium sp. N502536]|uniref:hypothetical protein n=1 Tax=Flavobacterium sp. N502536 TaxID=2986837 RepID=UPI002222A4C3|nr:hypothetical protein [Flavobacterium sp. N502536]
MYALRQYYNFIIIEFHFLFYIYLISSLVFGLLFYKYQKNHEGKSFKIWNYSLSIIIIYGSISCATFILSNDYLSTNKEYSIISPILEKHENYRNSPNYIVVDIEGTKREINIHDYDFKEISIYNFARITIKKGYWGFPIIIETKLKLDQ